MYFLIQLLKNDYGYFWDCLGKVMKIGIRNSKMLSDQDR